MNVPTPSNPAEVHELVRLHHELLHRADRTRSPTERARILSAAATLWQQVLPGQAPGQLGDLGASMDALRDSLASAVSYQIDKADAGVPLASAQTAEFATNALYNTGKTVVDASLRAAYWLAVARRLGAGKDAVEKARWLYRTAWLRTFWFEDESPPAISAIYSEARALILPYAGRAGVAAVVAILSRLQSSDLISATQTRRADADPASVIKHTVFESASDAGSAAASAAGLARGLVDPSYKPPDETDWSWWWKKNSVRLAIGLVAIAALSIVFRPYVQAYTMRPVLSGPAPVRQNRGRRRRRR